MRQADAADYERDEVRQTPPVGAYPSGRYGIRTQPGLVVAWNTWSGRGLPVQQRRRRAVPVLRIEAADLGVKVSVVCPGNAHTRWPGRRRAEGPAAPAPLALPLTRRAEVQWNWGISSSGAPGDHEEADDEPQRRPP